MLSKDFINLFKTFDNNFIIYVKNILEIYPELSQYLIEPNPLSSSIINGITSAYHTTPEFSDIIYYGTIYRDKTLFLSEIFKLITTQYQHQINNVMIELKDSQDLELLRLTTILLKRHKDISITIDYGQNLTYDFYLQKLRPIALESPIEINLFLSGYWHDSHYFFNNSNYLPSKNNNQNTIPILYLDKVPQLLDLILQSIPKDASTLEQYLCIRDMVRLLKKYYLSFDMNDIILPGACANPLVVLFSPCINCYGYAKLNEMLVDRLNNPNLKCTTVEESELAIGVIHARNLISINDTKSGIRGIYFDDLFLDRIRPANQDHNSSLINLYNNCLINYEDLFEFIPNDQNYQKAFSFHKIEDFKTWSSKYPNSFLDLIELVIKKISPKLYNYLKSPTFLNNFSQSAEAIKIVGEYIIKNSNIPYDYNILLNSILSIKRNIYNQVDSSDSSFQLNKIIKEELQEILIYNHRFLSKPNHYLKRKEYKHES